MRILLDTHTFLWWVLRSPNLSEAATEAIADRRNEVLLSAASVWELMIKASRGKIQLDPDPLSFVRQQVALNGFVPLPVTLEHAMGVYALPHHHGDPFDRLLVAQALAEDAPLVTADRRLDAYPATILW